jgi:hypothetical protein
MWASAVQAVASLAMLLVLVIYRGQLNAMRDTAKAQNVQALFDLLTSPSTREALVRVREELRSKKFDDWSDEDKVLASRVCSVYNLSALMAQERLVSLDLVVDNWASSIVDCHQILAPFLAERRKNNFDTYWSGFSQMYHKAVERYGSNALVLPGL